MLFFGRSVPLTQGSLGNVLHASPVQGEVPTQSADGLSCFTVILQQGRCLIARSSVRYHSEDRQYQFENAMSSWSTEGSTVGAGVAAASMAATDPEYTGSSTMALSMSYTG